jgi:protein phosphatase
LLWLADAGVLTDMNDLESRISKLEHALSEFSHELRFALGYIRSDAASSLTKSRVVLEKLLLRIYRAEMGQEPRKPLLGDLLNDNQFTRKFERRVVSRMNAIRDMGNLGPHGEPVEPRDAARVLDDLCEVLDWYLQRYGVERLGMVATPEKIVAPAVAPEVELKTKPISHLLDPPRPPTPVVDDAESRPATHAPPGAAGRPSILKPSRQDSPPRSTRERMTLLPSLPRPPVDFIDRVDLLARLRSQLLGGGLIILKGEGGMGKTALALQTIHDLRSAGQLEKAVAWINCELFRSYSEFFTYLDSILSGDRLDLGSVEKIPGRILDSLHESLALLALDNFEGVVREGPILTFLAEVRAPARVLVITREVPPGLLGQVVTLHELPREEAVQLFVRRASSRGISLDQRNSVIDELCASVGDLPLAIELLAARSARLPLPYLIQSLRHNLNILGSGFDPTRADRHQSAEACIAVSYQRLGQAARDLMLRLSPLPDGVCWEVISAIMAAEDWRDAAEELVSASMWRLDGERYVCHPLIRKYALERLGEERKSAGLRAARALIGLVIQQDQRARHTAIAARLDVLNWIESEWRNLLECAEYAIASQDWGLVQEFLGAVRYFCSARGHTAECEQLWKRLLAEQRLQRDRCGEACTLNELGIIYQYQRKWQEAESSHQEALSIAVAMANSAVRCQSLNGLGIVYQNQGQLADAERVHREALTLCEVSGDQAVLSQTLNNLGAVFQRRYCWTEAEATYRRALDLCRDQQDRYNEGPILNNLGIICQNQGRWEDAERAHKEALLNRKVHGDRVGEGPILNNLGVVHQNQGRWHEAEAAYAESLAICREFGDLLGEAQTLNNHGFCLESQGRWDEAELSYREALTLSQSVTDHIGTEQTKKDLARLASFRTIAQHSGPTTSATQRRPGESKPAGSWYARFRTLMWNALKREVPRKVTMRHPDVDAPGDCPTPTQPTLVAGALLLKYGVISTVGNYREQNEDNFYVPGRIQRRRAELTTLDEPEARPGRSGAGPDGPSMPGEGGEIAATPDDQPALFLVADGMGGQNAGEEASRLAIAIISEEMARRLAPDQFDAKETQVAIRDSVAVANQEILGSSGAVTEFSNMGTTVVLALFRNDTVYVAGIGNSRAYRLRAGRLERLTKDHSLADALLEAGTITPEELPNHKFKNVLYLYLGSKEARGGPEDVRVLDVVPGDRFLLASDGLWGVVGDDELTRILTGHDDPQRAARALTEQALTNDSKDNITSLVIHVSNAPPHRPAATTRPTEQTAPATHTPPAR